MFQLAILLLIGVAIVAGGLWLAANPGSLSVAWLGWQIDTNMIFGLIGLVVLFVVFLVLVRVLLAVLGMFGLRGVKSRGNLLAAARGLGEGYAALRAGNGAVGQVEARRARAAWADPAKSPGSLMEADGHAMAGNADEAREIYKALLKRPETEAAALRGLLDLAVAEGDDVGIAEYSDRALFKCDKPVWAARAALDLAARGGQTVDLERPLQVLEAAGEDDVTDVRRMRGQAFLARARTARSVGKTGEVVSLCQQALDVATEVPEVVEGAARLLAAVGKDRKAEKAVEDAWKKAPDVRLARVWRDLSDSSDAMALANRMQSLAAFNPEHPESRMAAAEAAADAGLWGQARTQLQPLLADAPPLRACLVMARVEEGDSGGADKVQAWLSRAAAAAGGLGDQASTEPVRANAA